MATKTDIFNMALAHLGIKRSVTNADSDTTQDARELRIFYATARQATLRDAYWPEATKFVTLGLVADDPTDEWDYSYRYPSDSLKVRRFLSGTRNDTRQSRVPFRIAQDDEGKLIYVDMEDAQIEYTVDLRDETLFSPEFTLALSYRLAAYVGPSLSAGDPFKLGEQASTRYDTEIGRARRNAADEEQPDEDPDSEFINARS